MNALRLFLIPTLKEDDSRRGSSEIWNVQENIVNHNRTDQRNRFLSSLTTTMNLFYRLAVGPRRQYLIGLSYCCRDVDCQSPQDPLPADILDSRRRSFECQRMFGWDCCHCHRPPEVLVPAPPVSFAWNLEVVLPFAAILVALLRCTICEGMQLSRG